MRGMYGLIGLVVFSMLGGIALAASPLDGTQWRVELTPKGATIPFHVDRVRFEEGNFTSAIFAPKGFSMSRYTLTEKTGGAVWTTTQKSPTEGTLSWRGELKGESMNGTLSWEQPDGKIESYTFTGRKVTEPPPEPEPKAPAKSP